MAEMGTSALLLQIQDCNEEPNLSTPPWQTYSDPLLETAASPFLPLLTQNAISSSFASTDIAKKSISSQFDPNQIQPISQRIIQKCPGGESSPI